MSVKVGQMYHDKLKGLDIKVEKIDEHLDDIYLSGYKDTGYAIENDGTAVFPLSIFIDEIQDGIMILK